MSYKEAAGWKVWKTMQQISEIKYNFLGLIIFLSALLIRMYELGERVFHHDESIHASFTLKLLDTGEYIYQPSYHGPFLFHTTAIIFHYLGINDATARLIPVFFGVATILLLFLLEKELGKKGVLWSAFLIAFSPSMVYYSRFFRNDLTIVFCTLATVAGGIRYLENLNTRKRYPYLLLVASSLAIAVASKENAYLVILMFGAYGGLLPGIQVLFRMEKRKFKLNESSPTQRFSCSSLPSRAFSLNYGILFHCNDVLH